MKLTLLGTSDYQLDYPLASAGYMVQTKTTTLKLDFGRGNLVRMVEAGIDWKTTNAVLISHVHPDHVSDLMQYLQLYTLAHHDGRLKTKVPFYGPRGFEAWFQQMHVVTTTIWDHIPTAADVFDQPFTIGDCIITPAPMTHSIDAVGYRIEAEGKVLCYTGDAAYSPELVQLARHANVLLAECSAPSTDNEAEAHLRPQDVARIASEANVQRVVLTHYPGDPAVREQRAQEIRSYGHADVIAGTDLQVFDLS